MYHVELRQFPHNFCRFNLSEQELREVVLDAWAREEWLEFGERKWNPHEASLTVLEGPRLELQELAMGRGWRNAQRRGEDVTERIVAARRAALAAERAPAGAGAGRGARRLWRAQTRRRWGARSAPPARAAPKPSRRSWSRCWARTRPR